MAGQASNHALSYLKTDQCIPTFLRIVHRSLSTPFLLRSLGMYVVSRLCDVVGADRLIIRSLREISCRNSIVLHRKWLGMEISLRPVHAGSAGRSLLRAARKRFEDGGGSTPEDSLCHVTAFYRIV